MVWNVEQSGALRSFRIMQKRGVIVDADDFLPIRSTYPEHDLTKVVPNARTMDELKDKRRFSMRQKIDQQTQIFEQKRQKHMASTERPYIYSEFNKGNKPRFSSIGLRKENDKQEARKKANLTSTI